jgi:hypothetical protein
MSSDRVLAAVAALRAAHDELDACDFDAGLVKLFV